MDEMNLLTAMRDEVPRVPPSPAAERLFRAGLSDNQQSERERATRSRPRSLPGVTDASGRLRWRRLAMPAAVAVGLAAVLVAFLLPRGAGTPSGQETADPSAGTVISAQLLADIAGQAVLAQRPVKPDQWVYQKLEVYAALPPGAPSYVRLPVKQESVQTQWTLADGGEQEWGPVNGHMIGGLVLTGPAGKAGRQALAEAARAYADLGSLPKNPAALEDYLAHRRTPPHTTQAELSVIAYSAIQDMLSSEILPPSLTAELYHALADVPGVIAKKDVTDIAGRPGVEFILPRSPDNTNLGTILSATTYQYLGQATWPSPPYTWKKQGNGWSGPGPIIERVLLAQALVSGPGVVP